MFNVWTSEKKSIQGIALKKKHTYTLNKPRLQKDQTKKRKMWNLEWKNSNLGNEFHSDFSLLSNVLKIKT